MEWKCDGGRARNKGYHNHAWVSKPDRDSMGYPLSPTESEWIRDSSRMKWSMFCCVCVCVVTIIDEECSLAWSGCLLLEDAIDGALLTWISRQWSRIDGSASRGLAGRKELAVLRCG